MAHPYSSTPAYSATPSYAGQQSFYPSYQPNPFQQSVQTPPGLPQPPHPPTQSMPPYQPSPSTNTARFDANSQVRPPAPLFPFPPTTFTQDIFKQFASAGLPPPPPPSMPPVPLPNSGYPQFSAPLNVSGSSPYPQHGASGSNGFGSGFYANEQAQPSQQDPFTTSQQGSRGMGDYRSSITSESQSYPAPRVSHGGTQQPSTTANRGGDRDHDQVLPSFGSRSDIDLLFATAQKQVHTYNQDGDTSLQPHQSAAMDGNASPYDPTRPAVLASTTSGGFGPPRAKESASFERTYDTNSLAELRQAAKGALLSLVPHKILYVDLINEGIDSTILQHLYGELGLNFDNQTIEKGIHPAGQARVEAPSGVTASNLQPTAPQTIPSSLQGPLSPAQIAPEPSRLPQVVSASTDGVASPAIRDLGKQNPAPSPSLERKDRIAQLLAAKTGRATAVSPVAAPSSLKEQSRTTSAARLGDANLDGTSFSRPESTDSQGNFTPDQQTATVQNSVIDTQRWKQQPQRLSQHPSGTSQAQQPRNELPSLSGSQSAKVTQQIGQISGDQLQLSDSQSAFASMIPGLFMSSAESAPDDVVMSSAINHDSDIQLQNTLSTSALPLKRPLQAESDILPQAKRANLSWDLRGGEKSVEVNTPDDASEGEIVEDVEEGHMAVDDPRDVNGSGGHGSTELDSYDQQAVTQLQGFSANEAAASDSYHTKQSEIEAMRRRITEMEQRKQLKRSSSQDNSPNAPVSSMPPIGREVILPSSSPARGGFVQSRTNTPSDLPQKPSAVTKAVSKLTPAQLAERTAALKAEVLRQRARRQQVLQEELPTLNTEVQKMEDRLEQARVDLRRAREDVAKCQHELSQAKQAEKEFGQEVQHLEKQVQDGRSGQKQYSDELHQIQREKLEESQHRSNNAGGNQPAQLQKGTNTTAVEEVDTDGSTGIGPPQDSMSVSSSNNQMGVNLGGENMVLPPLATATPERDLDDGNEDIPQTDEMEISPEPEPEPTTMTTTFPADNEANMPRQPTEEPTIDIDQDSDGSASMSDSGSDRDDEDYEPADADLSQPMQQSDEESDEYDPEEAPVSDFTPGTGADGEEPDDYYEPAESIGVLDSAVSGTPARDTDVINDSSRSTPSLDKTPADKALEGAEAVSVVSMDHRQDRAEQGLPAAEVDALVKTDNRHGDESTPNTLLDGRSPPNPHFVPYKTPLSSFKTFRFHQAFDDTVKTGYRSLTYSNNIDPSRPLCPTELSGELCTDSSCEEQHFRQLGLSDDKILVQMSSASDIKDKARRDQYLVGLKQVIADLRQKEVKEFENVAQALSAYRRQFFAEKEEVS